MSIKTADIIKYLRSTRGIVAEVSRDTGIDQFHLYRWKDGKSEPRGDEMLALYDYVKSKLGFGEPGKNKIAELVSVPVTYLQLLETQVTTLTQTNAALLKTINSLWAKIETAGADIAGSLAYQTPGTSATRYKQAESLSESELKTIAAQADLLNQHTDESLRKKKSGKLAQ